VSAGVFDLLLRGGTLVTSRGTFAADIGVRDGRIAALLAPGATGHAEAHQVLDIDGRYVLPGVIDAHVHFREPGLEYKEDFLTGSRAAVMGGVTTVLDMPNTVPATATADLLQAKRRLAEGRAYTDFGFYGLLAQDNLSQLRPMAEAGAIGFKCFLGRSTGDITPPDDGLLVEALGVVRELGLRCAFHAENDVLLQHAAARLRAAGRSDPLAHVEARPVLAEVEAIQRIGLFAAHTGAAIHVLHLSSADGLAVVNDWRRRGVEVTCEVTPQHLFLTADDMARHGALMRINPPVREPGHGVALLRGLADGRIEMLATDHSPHTAAEKQHDDIWQAVSGFPGVETSLRLLLTFGVHAGVLTLSDVARVMSENPARVWGLYPRKGSLTVGADADLTVVDLEVEDTIDEARLHGKNNLSPWVGTPTRGAAVATLVRGQVVMRDGELVGPPRGMMVQRAS
jgi:dihydroorotase